MRCPEERVLSFLDGDLSQEQAQAFDEHLLECERCWAAIREDRAGRMALMSLRAPAPEWLADRVALTLEVAGVSTEDAPKGRGRRGPTRPGTRDGNRLRGRVVGSAAIVITLVGCVLGFTLIRSSAVHDPAQVTAVIALAEADSTSSSRVSPTVHLMVEGQAVVVSSVRYHGQMVTVATSSRPFPMPPLSHVLTGSSHGAWMATHGVLAEYCVNKSVGKSSMLVVAKMPAAELPEIAAHLHLI